jgi:DNA polymerase III gamma/tau subunit
MLYQEVRPTTLEEIIGNKATVRALQKAIKVKGRAHCYLFHGPSGSGKTTMARAMALALGCNPINIIEKNSAQERGIDMARDLTEMMQYAPLGGGVRCVIFDEGQMLTREAQNGLLKVLEDVPDFQYFFICSTDPAKLLLTIRNRCEQVVVEHLNNDDMAELLLTACAKGGLPEPTDKVLTAIIKAANGCPREGLVFLEKQNGLTEDDALKLMVPMFGAEGQVLAVCQLLVKRAPWSAITAAIAALPDPDWEGTRQAVLGYLASCLARSPSDGEAIRLAEMIRELKESVFYSGKAGMLAALFFAHIVK